MSLSNEESTFITFGQSHTHRANGVTIDCDIVAKVRSREHAVELFGTTWAFEYTWDSIKDNMHFFPRGIIDLT